MPLNQEELRRFLAKDSPQLALIEGFLRDQKRKALEQYPNQDPNKISDVARLHGQVAELEKLAKNLREDLRAYWQAQNQAREANT